MQLNDEIIALKQKLADAKYENQNTLFAVSKIEKKSNHAYLIFRYHQKSWKKVMITFNGLKMKFGSVKGHQIYFFNLE